MCYFLQYPSLVIFLSSSFFLCLWIRILPWGTWLFIWLFIWIYFIDYLFGFVCMYINIFINIDFRYLVVNQCYHSFCCTNGSGFGHWKCLQVPSVSYWCVPRIYWMLPYSLASQDIPASCCIFLLQFRNQSVHQGTLVLFIREWHLENNFRVLSMLPVPKDAITPSPRKCPFVQCLGHLSASDGPCASGSQNII